MSRYDLRANPIGFHVSAHRPGCIFSKKGVGWILEGNMRTEMVQLALEKTYASRSAGEHVIDHSDHGVQYASKQARDFWSLKELSAA
jgi:hypothetical protein